MSSLILQNFRSQNLQGRSFKGRDLTNTDFSHADIRGADFTNAILDGANFSHACCGLTIKPKIKIFIIVAVISAISGISAVIAASQTFFSLLPGTTKHLGFLPTVINLSVCAILLAVMIRQGMQKALDYLGIAAAVFVPLIGFLAALTKHEHPILSWFISFKFVTLARSLFGQEIGYNPNNIPNDIPFLIMTLTVTVVATTIAIVALPLALTLAEVVLGRKIANLALFEALAIGAIATGILARNDSRQLKKSILINAGLLDKTNNSCSGTECLNKFVDPPAIIAFTAGSVIIAVTLILLGFYITKKVLAEDDKYAVIRQLVIVMSAADGTSFRGAKLANTNFTEAILKNTDFRFATIHRTLWRHAKSIDWARVDETILIHPSVGIF